MGDQSSWGDGQLRSDDGKNARGRERGHGRAGPAKIAIIGDKDPTKA
jgi:hypothetical protein